MRSPYLRSSYLKGIAALALVLALGACAGNSSSSGSANGGSNSSSGNQTTSIDFPLGSFNGEIYVLDYVGKQEGFFAKNGLNVTFISPSQGGATANSLFLGGTLKGWPGNPSSIMVDLSKGENIQVAGMLNNWIPFQVVVPKSSPLAHMQNATFAQKMEALKGKRIGLTAVGSLVYQSLVAGLDSANVPVSDVTILGIGQPTSGIGQIKAGRIDGYVTYSRTDTAVMGQLANTVPFVSLDGPEAPAAIRCYSSYALPVLGSLEKSNPKAVADYVTAQEEAYDWTKTHINQAAQIVANQIYNGQYTDIIVQALNQLFAQAQPDGFKVDQATWNSEVQLLVNEGQVPKTAVGTLAYNKVVLPSAQAG